VPAAAVTPAPKAYIKVAAVKKLVVGSGSCDYVSLLVSYFGEFQAMMRWSCSLSAVSA
jgi:hypothetical protein